LGTSEDGVKSARKSGIGAACSIGECTTPGRGTRVSLSTEEGGIWKGRKLKDPDDRKRRHTAGGRPAPRGFPHALQIEIRRKKLGYRKTQLIAKPRLNVGKRLLANFNGNHENGRGDPSSATEDSGRRVFHFLTVPGTTLFENDLAGE